MQMFVVRVGSLIGTCQVKPESFDMLIERRNGSIVDRLCIAIGTDSPWTVNLAKDAARRILVNLRALMVEELQEIRNQRREQRTYPVSYFSKN